MGVIFCLYVEANKGNPDGIFPKRLDFQVGYGWHLGFLIYEWGGWGNFDTSSSGEDGATNYSPTSVPSAYLFILFLD